MGDSLGVEHEPVRCGRGPADRLAHPPCDVAGVGKEQPVVESVDDDARHNAGIWSLSDVCETTKHRVKPKHRVAGPGTATYRIEDREPDGEHDRLEHPDHHDAHGRDRRDRELDSIGRRQRSPRRDVDQPDRRGNDRRAKHRLGKMGDRRGQEEQDPHHRDGCDHCGHLAASPHRVIYRSARSTRTDRERL